MKHLIKPLLTALLLLCSAVLNAHDFEVDGIYYNILSEEDKTVEVTFRSDSYGGYENEYTNSVVIPQSVAYNGKSYNVTSIGSSAFESCTGLTSITIPNSVTSIGSSAFSACSALTNIELPNSVTSIGSSAFYGCSGLTSITIPNSVTCIDLGAFYGCTGLVTVKIPATVTSIGINAFGGCSNLTNIIVLNYNNNTIYDSRDNCNAIIETASNTLICGCKNTVIPSNVKNIGEFAFSGCSGLTSIKIPGGVKSIGEGAFYECSALVSINIPEGVTNIGSQTFYGCSGLTSIEIPNSVTSIGDKAFSSCKGLTSATIGNSITSIGFAAFEYCSSLTSIEIPNSVTSIESVAFFGCNRLATVKIPAAVTSIGINAFGGCSNLTNIIVDKNNTVYNSNSNCNAIIETASNILISGCKSTIIPSSVTSVGEDAFYNCTGLKCIEIPEGVTSIEYRAFYSCTGLTSIISEIPADKLFVPGSYAFYNVDKTNCTLYVPAGAVVTYATTDGWKDFKNIVEIKNTYKLTFVVDDKEFTIDSVAEGDKIIYPEIPEKEGYTFMWDTNIDIMPSNDITITGKYVANSYLLTYKIDCNVYASDSIAYGTTITPIAEPTKEGHTFSGWSEIPATMPANDVIIEGTFSINSYTITYKVDGEVYATDSVAYGATIEPAAEPTKEGHTFSGWSEIPETMPANDVVIEGTFSINTYNITYKVDGEIYVTDSIKFGATITPIAAPTKEGHTFSGWSEIPATMPANDVIIEGSFSINTYNITYKVDGEIYATDSIKFGATIEPIAEPTKEGHTFSGWSEIPETMPANDVVIEGSFSINSYTVTYKVDGEVYKTETVAYGATITPIAPPTKEGHTFSGWSEIPATMPAKDVVVGGTFSINSYTVTFMVDGKVYETMTVEYGATITPIAPPTKVGHTFSGWSEIPATMPANDVVIEGSFSVNSYTVTFIVDGEVYETMTVKYGATIEPISEPTKEGHTFSGWSEIPATMPAKDVIIEGTFSINSYTITFMVDGEVYETMTVEYGAEIEFPTSPEKEGYIFTGWIGVPATMPAEDIVIEGRFEVDTTSINAVTLDLEKNEVYNLKGQRITESENLTRGIYIINGRKVLIK